MGVYLPGKVRVPRLRKDDRGIIVRELRGVFIPGASEAGGIKQAMILRQLL